MSEEFTGTVKIIDDEGNDVFTFDAEDGTLRLGSVGRSGAIRLYDDDGSNPVAFGSEHAVVRVGEEDKEGHVRVIDSQGEQVFDLDGEHAILQVGGPGNEGDIRVLDGEDRRVFSVSGDHASLRVGHQDNAGDIKLVDSDGESTIHMDGESGDIFLENADTAEEFDVAADEIASVKPGTVVALDEVGELRRSRRNYDHRVAGVVSGAGELRPGIVLGRMGDPSTRLPVALSGRVNCWVDARDTPIEVGELLTTAETPGHAMAAIDSERAFGAVIGKALEPLADGTGMIPILVALQ